MVFLRHVVMLSLIIWSLTLPPQIPGEHGDAVAGSAIQQSFEWGSYDTKKACEQDRTNYSQRSGYRRENEGREVREGAQASASFG